MLRFNQLLSQYAIAFKSRWKWLHSQSYQRNTTMMMKWINNIRPGNPIQLVSVNWSVCVSHCSNNDDFLFESCGFQFQTLSPSWSSTTGGSWSPQMLCFPQSLLTDVPTTMGPSAFSIKRHVCAPHLFVLTDDFCNKTQTFWYFLDSWVMTLRFAFMGLWLSPVENVARKNY